MPSIKIKVTLTPLIRAEYPLGFDEDNVLHVVDSKIKLKKSVFVVKDAIEFMKFSTELQKYTKTLIKKYNIENAS